MDFEQIHQIIRNRFSDLNQSSRKIIFWYDSDGGFSDIIDRLSIPNVNVRHLTGFNNFLIKRLLELEDTTGNYLIYAPFARPKNEDDWLLDIYLYSEEFSADKASLIMNDLGISDLSMKGFIKANLSFFDNKDRSRRLEAIPHTLWDEESLELAMMAVACKQKTASIEGIVKKLLVEGIYEKDNQAWQEIGKWPGYDAFWRHMKREYGYEQEKPTLRKLLLSLLITSMEHELHEINLPATWGAYRVKQKANGVVFIDHWMNSREDSKAFDELAKEFEKELDLQNLISTWKVEQIQDCDIFPIFDKAVVIYILNSLQNCSQEYDRFLELISVRKTKHWYEEFQYIYNAITAAIELMRFIQEYASGFPVKSTYNTFQNYSKDYYRADQYYRCFYEAFDHINDQEILKRLQPLVENLYCNEYLQPLSLAWSQLLEAELVNNWPMPVVRQQKDFYQDNILPIIRGDREKAYVIISDAFRYEVAEELVSRLNQELKGSAELTAMQGVVPSYTKLGMAGLLPGNNLQITPQGRVMIDGKETESLDQRRKILQDAFPESTAISLQDLLSMNREDGREFAKAHRLIYIYHNMVDALGDKQTSEHRVFEAARQAINDINRCIKYIVNQLNGSTIFITADHGFLYQRETLAETDKLIKETTDIIDSNRRFILTANPPENNGLLAVDMQYILGEETNLKAVMPKGIHRFKTQGGGLAYVHGGASLQEIVVPLIQYKNIRTAKVKETAQKVDVKLTNTVRKITNNTFTLDFFQTERVSDMRLPRKLRIMMMDLEDGERKISDEKLLIAEKDSERAEERTFKIRLTLKSGPFDKTKDYYLCLFDEENDLNPEYEKIPFTINLGIINDFDDF